MNRNVTKSKKTRNIEPSQELLELIEIVNSIPAEIEFNDIFDSISFIATSEVERQNSRQVRTKSITETIFESWLETRKN